MIKENEIQLFETALKKVSMRLNQGKPIDGPLCKEKDLACFRSLAYSFYRSGDYAQSKMYFHRLILSKPLEQSYWVGLGSCFQMEKSYAAALKVWGMSSILDKDDPFAHFHAATCHFALGEFERGFLALEASKKLLKPKHQELRARIEQMENKHSNKRSYS